MISEEQGHLNMYKCFVNLYKAEECARACYDETTGKDFMLDFFIQSIENDYRHSKHLNRSQRKKIDLEKKEMIKKFTMGWRKWLKLSSAIGEGLDILRTNEGDKFQRVVDASYEAEDKEIMR